MRIISRNLASLAMTTVLGGCVPDKKTYTAFEGDLEVAAQVEHDLDGPRHRTISIRDPNRDAYVIAQDDLHIDGPWDVVEFRGSEMPGHELQSYGVDKVEMTWQATVPGETYVANKGSSGFQPNFTFPHY